MSAELWWGHKLSRGLEERKLIISLNIMYALLYVWALFSRVAGLRQCGFMLAMWFMHYGDGINYVYSKLRLYLS